MESVINNTITGKDLTGNELNLHNIYEKFTRVVKSKDYSSSWTLSKLDIQPEALRKKNYTDAKARDLKIRYKKKNNVSKYQISSLKKILKKKLRLFTVTPYTATDEDFTGNELNLHNIYEKFTRVVESENFSSDRMLSKLDIQPEALRKGFYRRKGERFKN